MELTEFTEVAADILTDVEFGVGAAVSHDAAEILEEMTIFGVDGAGTDDENFLNVAHSLVGLSTTERNVTDHIRRGNVIIVLIVIIIIFGSLLLFFRCC